MHITTSGMPTPRLLRRALDLRTADLTLLSGDYPFHWLDPASTAFFLNTLPTPADQEKIAHIDAEGLRRRGGPAVSAQT